ncbi:MAG: hypothetical protein JNJ59_14985 [Deltaproteobacteria bacterium]|nr:hypothetical protein [Deltaproteobacteria bacterium]
MRFFAPIPLDIQGDRQGARILYAGTRLEARITSPGFVEIDLPGWPPRLFNFATMSASAVRAEMVDAGAFWLGMVAGGVLFVDEAPTGEDFALAWDKHRRLWLEANAA